MKRIIIKKGVVKDFTTNEEIGHLGERHETNIEVILNNGTMKRAYYGTEVEGQFYPFCRNTVDCINGCKVWKGKDCRDNKKALEKAGYYLDD